VTRPRSSSLVRLAEAQLRRGATHTLDLAREILGISGHAGAASAAVFQLLGADRRFQVDAQGVWSLDPALAPLGTSLDETGFAVVDVETTGGGPDRGHRITEIAIVEVAGGRIADEFQTLVNPGRRIPPGVTSLTGITQAMVSEAPYFEHVADEVMARLEGRVFVAHNATFDWTFVADGLVRALGHAPDVVRMCTVRMVRRLVPALRHRNLDVVARHFGVPIHARHRAFGDALATARVFLRLLNEARGRGIEDVATLEWYLRRRRKRAAFDPRQIPLLFERSGRERRDPEPG
jgi:DNA polymerase III epsilon subunit family exonuclease